MKVICKKCKKRKKHCAKGLCKTCYIKEWRKDNIEKVRKYAREEKKKNYTPIGVAYKLFGKKAIFGIAFERAWKKTRDEKK